MMKEGSKNMQLLLWPVRRTLMAVTMAYLSGIFLSACIIFPGNWIIVLCALFLGLAVLRLAQRKSAVLCLCGALLLLGHGMAGHELMQQDLPTGTHAHIEGVVVSIEKEHRVALRDVIIDGERTLLRYAVVTLLPPENENTPIADTPKIGQRVSGTGRLFAPDEPRNPGGTNGRFRALARGYELSGYLQDGWKAEEERAFSLNAAFHQVREKIASCIERLFGERAALFLGVMLGDRSGIEKEMTHALQMTGTAHILTVSGLHLSMIAVSIGWVLDRMRLGRRLRFAALAACLAVFTGLTGCAAGTVRAMIMAMLREYARLRGRRYEPLTALSCAALAMTIVNPIWALDASFQFSFFVVLGLVLLSGGIAEMRSRRRQTLSRGRSAARMIFSIMGISLCAQVSELPMQLLLYGYVPLLALPMNILCGWLMPFVMLGGWICVLLDLVFPMLGCAAARLVLIPAMLFETISTVAASFSHAIVRLPAPYPVSIFLFALLMMLVSRRIRFGRLRGATAVLLAAAVLLTYLPRFDPRPRYVQLDVGQGDAALFREGRKAVISDIGPEGSVDLLRYLRHEGLLVDAVILSHLDKDHAGALNVLRDSEIRIPAIVLPEGALEMKADDSLAALFADLQDTQLHEVRRGDLLKAESLSMLVLAPCGEEKDSNEQSLVLHARMNGVTFLLTGDLPAKSEPDALPDSDVLKVAHHGSRDSTSEALLAGVRPKLALISVGKDNWYGHPHPEVMERLRNVGTKILRTDRDGCITVWLEDGGYIADCFVSE